MRKIIFIVLLCLVGCTIRYEHKLYPLPESGIKVIGDKIYHNSELFAELRYFTEKPYLESYEGVYSGVAIYYYRYDKEEWIFPEGGWSVSVGNTEYFAVQDVDIIWNQYRANHDRVRVGGCDIPLHGKKVILRLEGREAKIRPAVSDVKISEDGHYIYYKTIEFPFGSFYSPIRKYLVEYGISK